MELLQSVADSGYVDPTAVQLRAIPPILEGRDLLAAAQTGTGKTAGFMLPLLQTLMAAPPRRGRPVRALVLTPTRELAAQVRESARVYGAGLPLRSRAIFGGVGMQPQITALRQGVDVVIATPGRLLDHASRGTINLSAVEILVLDEADRMLDMGFIHDLRRVLALLPEGRQNLLFSATFAPEIRALARSLLREPVQIDVTPAQPAAETVEQHIYHVAQGEKAEVLAELIHSRGWEQVLIFTRTKHGANRLAARLQTADIAAAPIHSNKSQGARTRALAGFKAGEVRALVATDIASRGLDISGLPQVVNFELPHVPEDYVHRIGRTGRAGAGGAGILVGVTRGGAAAASDRAAAAAPVAIPDAARERGGARQDAADRRPARGGGGRSDASETAATAVARCEGAERDSAVRAARRIGRTAATMSDEKIEVEGRVSAVLGNDYYRVELANGSEALVRPAGRLRKFRIRTLLGDRVLVELSEYDLTRGRITYRFRD